MADDQDTMKPTDEQMSSDSQSETRSPEGLGQNSGDLSRSDMGGDGMGSGTLQPGAQDSLTRKGGMMLGRVSKGHERFGKMKNLLQDIIGRSDAMELRPTGVTLYAGNKALNLNDPALARALGEEHPSVHGWLDADNPSDDNGGNDEGVRE